jgi:hypothetical protein
MCLPTLIFSEPILKYNGKNIKDKSKMNSVTKGQNTQTYYSHSNFSFLFLRVSFEFGSEYLRECKYTSYEHP